MKRAAAERPSRALGDRVADLVERAFAFARRRIIELVIVAIGLAIRISLIETYHPLDGYDAHGHVAYIEWCAKHWSIPDVMFTSTAYHPPLYYFVAAAFSRLVRGDVALFGVPSVVFSSVNLLLIWFGIERYLPASRIARVVGLALAAILPSAVQLAGMASNEGLNGVLATAALLVAAHLLGRQRRGAPMIARAALLGLLVGLQMLAKVSALATIAAIGCVVAFEVLFGKGGGFGVRLRRAAPWLLTIGIFAGTTGWYFGGNQRLYHKPILSGWDGPDASAFPKIQTTPYFQRRAPDYFYGWSKDIWSFPYYPSGVSPNPHFWPVVVATTFVDYYNYGFVHARASTQTYEANGRKLPRKSLFFAGASAVAGTVVAASTAVAWLWALIVCLRRRDSARILFLVAPLPAFASLLHLQVKYPWDNGGLVKGVYLQFACGALFALYGLAVQKMFRHRITWPVAFLQSAAIIAIASYTFYARVFAH